MINIYPLASITNIDTIHSRVHEGRYFTGGYYNAALANNGVIELIIQSSATELTHVNFSGASNGDSIIQLYTGCTFSAAGTAVTMTNHNRTSSKVFSGTVTHTPTLTADGTQMNGTAFLAAGTKGSGAGEFGGFPQEFLLALSTNYLARITNISGGAVKISIHISGYQPTL